jgi:hypothetical protein
MEGRSVCNACHPEWQLSRDLDFPYKCHTLVVAMNTLDIKKRPKGYMMFRDRPVHVDLVRAV